MQQTTKYQLNLIETSDAFSPAPLNENAQKLENAIAAGDQAEAAARAAGDAALDQRVTALELHRIVVGFADSSSNMKSLGFTPKVVITLNGNSLSIALENFEHYGVKIVEGGFQHSGYFDMCYFAALA